MTSETPTTLPFDNDTLTKAEIRLGYGISWWTADDSGFLDSTYLPLLTQKIRAGEFVADATRFKLINGGSGEPETQEDFTLWAFGVTKVTTICGDMAEPDASFQPQGHFLYLGTNGKLYGRDSDNEWAELNPPPSSFKVSLPVIVESD